MCILHRAFGDLTMRALPTALLAAAARALVAPTRHAHRLTTHRAAPAADLALLRAYDRDPASDVEDVALRDAVLGAAAGAADVRLGVAAATQDAAVNALREWVGALSLPRGPLYGADVDGEPIDVPGPIFIKYASACGTARLRHDDDDRTTPGVLFYPAEEGDDVDASQQYLLPLELFARPKLKGRESRALRAHAARLGPDCPALAMAGDGSAPPGARFLGELDALLESRELVKVKMPGAGKKKNAKIIAETALAPALSRDGAPAYVAQVVGHTALLYRRSRKPTLDLEAMLRSDPNDLLG